MKPDGTMARTAELKEFAKEHNLKICTIDSLIEYRRKSEKLITQEGEASLPTVHGDFRMIGYKSNVDKTPHLALVHGEIDGTNPVLVRVQSE